MLFQAGSEKHTAVFNLAVKLLNPEPRRVLRIFAQSAVGVTEIVDITAVTADEIGRESVGKTL